MAVKKVTSISEAKLTLTNILTPPPSIFSPVGSRPTSKPGVSKVLGHFFKLHKYFSFLTKFVPGFPTASGWFSG